MESFKTLVMLDLETTGLRHEEGCCPKITEMTLICCLTSHIYDKKVPRMVNKLTLAFNPRRNISPGATKVTGLHNEFLEELKPFDDGTIEILNNFLTRFPHPLCLIAHNGNKFDFPILQRHLSKCSTKFLANIFCADSLIAFRQILYPSPSKRLFKTPNISPGTTTPTEDIPNQMRQSNEVTPEKQTIPRNINPVKGSYREVRDGVPTSFKARKRLFCGETRSERDEKSGAETKPASFKLKDVSEYLGAPPLEFHKAEDDCMALLISIVKCKEDFLRWLSENARPFEEIQPMI